MIDTQYTASPVCPWCGQVVRDAYEIRPGEAEWDEVIECGKCGRNFMCSQTIQIYYYTSKPKVDH